MEGKYTIEKNRRVFFKNVNRIDKSNGTDNIRTVKGDSIADLLET